MEPQPLSMMQPRTSIQQHGTIVTQPTRVFGHGEVILRIGNGGAGIIGLIEALANDYLSLRGTPGSIEWICNHSRNTQLALFNNHIDLALTYERDQEDISVLEGWAENAGCIFHDHFCLIGPEHDPANIRQAQSIEEAFERILLTESLFYSRADGSATMRKEREIWRRCHRSPWNAKSTWYIQTKHNPADAVRTAASSGGYLLTDRSTFLYQVRQGKAANCAVFFEPTHPFHWLMNSCYALHGPSAAIGLNGEISRFVGYLKTERGQGLIAAYGTEAGRPELFAPARHGIATTRLVGGRIVNGRWVGRPLSKL